MSQAWARNAEPSPAEPPLLTRVEQVRQLGASEADRGYPVRLTAVVTLADPVGLLYVQDESGGIFISPQSNSAVWRTGRSVEITGKTARGSHLPYVRQAAMRDLGPGILPPPRPVTMAELATDREDSNRVEVRGVIRYAAVSEGRFLAELHADGWRARVLVHDPVSAYEDCQYWVDAEVRVRAVCGVVSGAKADAHFVDLHVPTLADVEVEVKAPKIPEGIPSRRVVDFLSPTPAPSLVHRVLVRGSFERSEDGSALVRDATGAALIQTARRILAESNAPIEVIGFPAPGKAVIEDALVRVFAPVSLSGPLPGQGRTAGAEVQLTPILMDAAEVASLSEDEARRGYPARLQGVVTFWDPRSGELTLQDDTAAIAVEPDPAVPIAAGTLVEVEGLASLGRYAPIVTHARIRSVRSASLPRAERRTYQELLSGSYDSRRVEALGVVRAARTNDGALTLSLGTDGGSIEAIIPDFKARPVPQHLVDAQVRVAGVCGTLSNSKRQLLGVWLGVNGLDDVNVARPAPADPFAMPARPVRALLGFSPRDAASHRVLVRGTVTYRDPAWHTFFIQEGNEGLYVRTLQKPEMAVGDEVEVVGFPSPGPLGPTLQDSIWRRTRRGEPPAPVAVSTAEAISGRHDNQLVTLGARLVARMSGMEGRGLVLQAEAWTLLGLLEGSQDPTPLDGIPIGSKLRLTGVSSAQYEAGQSTSALRVLLRSPSDVVLVSKPSWWTPRRLLQLLGVGLAGLAATAGWVFLLRRRVREQTAEIHREAMRQAALEARYRELFEHANDIVFSLDLQGRVTDVNPAGERILGYPREELLCRPLESFVREDQAGLVRHLDRREPRQDATTTQEITALARDGSPLQLEVSSWLSRNDGQPAGIHAIARDISERRRAEQVLREREEHFRSLIEHAVDLIGIVRANGVFTFLSPSVERVLGYPPAELLGKDAFEFVHPEDRAIMRIALGRAAGHPLAPRAEICRFRHRDGNWRVLEGGGRFLSKDASGQDQFVLNFHDITERRLLEDQLRQAQKMEAIGQLAGGVAHDFNNLLTVIQGHCSLLMADREGARPAEDSVEHIAEAAQRASNLTRQLLAFSRQQVMKLKPMDLNQALGALSKLLRRLLGENVILELQAAAGLPPVEADEGMIDQIVINLSVNARDAMPQGGRLTIRTEAVRLDALNPPANPEGRAGNFVCLSVSDTGVGMDEATRKRMFEPFFTTKEVGKGTGLGLATVYGIVKQHQGWAEVESVPHQGATFRIYLPAAPTQPADPAPPAAEPKSEGRQETVFLVEDEPAVRQLAKRCLTRNGYRVLEAANGPEALRLWQEHAPEIDLLFTDMVMPEGLSGLELAHRLRAVRPELKVIVSSGYSVEMAAPDALAAEQVTYLSKPYQMTALTAAVRKCLDGN